MMENGLCKYGEIWLNMDKLYPKKKQNGYENDITIFSYLHQNKTFKKNIAGN